MLSTIAPLGRELIYNSINIVEQIENILSVEV